jgi:hypothetical protein
LKHLTSLWIQLKNDVTVVEFLTADALPRHAWFGPRRGRLVIPDRRKLQPPMLAGAARSDVGVDRPRQPVNATTDGVKW